MESLKNVSTNSLQSSGRASLAWVTHATHINRCQFQVGDPPPSPLWLRQGIPCRCYWEWLIPEAELCGKVEVGWLSGSPLRLETSTESPASSRREPLLHHGFTSEEVTQWFKYRSKVQRLRLQWSANRGWRQRSHETAHRVFTSVARFSFPPTRGTDKSPTKESNVSACCPPLERHGYFPSMSRKQDALALGCAISAEALSVWLGGSFTSPQVSDELSHWHRCSVAAGEGGRCNF